MGSGFGILPDQCVSPSTLANAFVNNRDLMEWTVSQLPQHIASRFQTFLDDERHIHALFRTMEGGGGRKASPRRALEDAPPALQSAVLEHWQQANFFGDGQVSEDEFCNAMWMRMDLVAALANLHSPSAHNEDVFLPSPAIDSVIVAVFGVLDPLARGFLDLPRLVKLVSRCPRVAAQLRRFWVSAEFTVQPGDEASRVPQADFLRLLRTQPLLVTHMHCAIQTTAAIRIQSAWRGWSVRQRLKK
eukprot:NODE_575_length_865_cov_494.602941_g439_i0.p1 GENE.NODE_575_length_865_cov_494.602941_g439_i0~~NODE_575_length_865_cov_494.602941_g439_i0.p1  ORF type:complete len:253 (-),score=54.49 NODE_575_length_865_cov_494.602941_g439_i0:106-840(-)